MGGMAGVVHFRGDSPEPRVIRAMSERLAHRGPDGEGEFLEGPAALAHRRRAVVPIRSTQPLVADDYVVMMDGWVYDHEDLARRAGSRDRVAIDTQAVLQAWRRWGLGLTERLDGEFALTVWDRRNQTLFLLRDRMGVRPLYWAREGGRFAFASELPALLAVPWVRRELARENIAEYLSFRVVHSPRTLLRDVHQVEPAHWLRVNADLLKTRRYWRLTYAPSRTPRPREGDVIPALQETVERAVRRRLRGGAPAALYLSGGLGSTAIAAAARTMHQHLPTYTISFDDDPFPESPFAGRVARLLGLEHHEVVVGTAELAATFCEAVAALGHPVGNPAAVLQLLLARTARSQARVVLSGDGGEELFGGRMLAGPARSLRLAKVFSALPGLYRRPLGSLLTYSRRGRRIAAPLAHYGLELALGGYDLFSDEERISLLRDPVDARTGVRRRVLEPFYARLDTDPLNAILNAYLRSWLCEESLVRADRTAASAGLDVRFPLLDREVVSMAAALPGTFKVRRVGGSLHTRWPLRAMLQGVIPPPLVNRPKRGMPAPLDAWLSGPGRLFMEERFARLKRDPQKLWRPEALDDLRRDVNRTPGAGMRLWALVVLDCWFEGLVNHS